MTKTMRYRNSSVSYFIRADLETAKISPDVYNFKEQQMRVVHSIEFHSGSKEEKLPGFSGDFPYIDSCWVFYLRFTSGRHRKQSFLRT